MRIDAGLFFRRVLFVAGLFLFVEFLLFSFQGSAFAVLKAEGGKEVAVADPLKDKASKKTTAAPVGYTSRIPKSTRASASDEAVPQQSGALPAQVNGEVPQSRPINYQSSVAANAQPIIITASMKPTTISPMIQSVKAVSQPAPTASPANPPAASSLKGYMGCILAGTLVKDITVDVCNSKGGKPLMTSVAAPAPAPSAPPAPPPAPPATPPPAPQSAPPPPPPSA